MTNISATPLTFDARPEAIRLFLANMNNFKIIMPDQVEQWQSEDSSCSFFIKNLGSLSMQKDDNINSGVYSFSSTETSKVKFKLSFHFDEASDNSYVGYFALNAEMNQMVEMLARRPLTNFVNILTENMQKTALSGT